MLKNLLNQLNKESQRQRAIFALNVHPYTNEDRLHVWKAKQRRLAYAALNGRLVSFPLPITRV